MRHQYRVLNEHEKQAMVLIKDAGIAFDTLISSYVPNGREQALAKTKIEEAVMWAVKGLTA
jgi:ribonucleotide reductase beta subunit family protein with ferritin-like domain